MAFNRGQAKKSRLSNLFVVEQKIRILLEQRNNIKKACVRRVSAGLSFWLLAASLVMLSLVASSTAASSAPRARLLASAHSPAYQALYGFREAQPSWPSESNNADVPTIDDDSNDYDADVSQFVKQLLAARRLLDEKLAREAEERHAGVIVDGSQLSDARERYEMLANENDIDNNSEVDVKQQQPPPTRVTTNPMYYSVSQDDAIEPADGEFSGQFGEPLAARQQASKRGPSAANERSPARLTTLLEDEPNEEQNGDKIQDESANSKRANNDAPAAAETTTTTITEPFDDSASDKLEPADKKSEQQRATNDQMPATMQQDQNWSAFDYLGSLFGQVYTRVADGLSYFATKNATTSSSEGTNVSDHMVSSPISSGLQAAQSQVETEAGAKAEAEAEQEATRKTATESKDTKQKSTNSDKKRTDLSSISDDGVGGVSQKPSDDTKQGASVVLNGTKSNNQVDEPEGRQKQQEPNESSGALSRVRLERLPADVDETGHEPSYKRIHVDASNSAIDGDEQMWPTKQLEQIKQQQQQEDNVNLMRLSKLVLPGEESLVSKYVYAPTQHYYLGANTNTGAHQATPLGGATQAGDWLERRTSEQQQESPRQPAPAYAFGKLLGPEGGQVSLVPAQQQHQATASNDVYFLAMVGAFCAMAMAAVLTAGLFAYRVQQNRKLSQAEQEYPTYGVVGPNSALGAKCAAAAFAPGGPGYFGGGPGGQPFGQLTVGGPGGKSASAKHLPDLYAAANDSGLASLERICSASKKSSSSASSATTGASGDHQRQTTHQQHLGKTGATNQRTHHHQTLGCAMANNQDAARMYHYQHQKQQMIASDRSSAGRHTSASDMDSDDDNDDGSYTVYECPGLASAHEMEIKNPLFNDERTP